MLGKHTIFGRVCEGIAVVKKMSMVETGANDRWVPPPYTCSY